MGRLISLYENNVLTESLRDEDVEEKLRAIYFKDKKKVSSIKQADEVTPVETIRITYKDRHNKTCPKDRALTKLVELYDDDDVLLSSTIEPITDL